MAILDFIKDLLIATFGQIASVFGGIFIFGLLIHFVSRLTFNSLEKSFGVKGTYLVAWIGTPVHELGHAVFCLIFAHKITGIAFFRPDPDTGELGYVAHRWNPRNPWQVLGNYFIGIGPVLFGCAVLLAVFYFLVPEGPDVWKSITALSGQIDQGNLIGSYYTVIRDSSVLVLGTIFNTANLADWRFWIFFYVSICIASNIRLSPSDLKGAFSGLGCVILPFLLLNLIGLVSGSGGDKFLPLTASSIGVIFSLFILAFVMALSGFVIVYLVSAAWVKIRRGHILRPF